MDETVTIIQEKFLVPPMRIEPVTFCLRGECDAISNQVTQPRRLSLRVYHHFNNIILFNNNLKITDFKHLL